MTDDEAADSPSPGPGRSSSERRSADAGADDDWALARRRYRRSPRSPAAQARIRVRNLRVQYLMRNPSYLDDPEHELADPLLYERLVGGFQTPGERGRANAARGYGRLLEADLARGEQRAAGAVNGRPSPSASSSSPDDAAAGSPSASSSAGYDNAWDAPARDRDHGRELWLDFLRSRFVRGLDDDFDYAAVDDSPDLDFLAERDAEEAYFDDEEPSEEAPPDAGAGSPLPAEERSEIAIQYDL